MLIWLVVILNAYKFKKMQLLVFEYEEENHLNKLRTVEIDGEVWFVAADVTEVLGYANSSKAVADHCKEKGITKRYPLETSGGSQLVTLVNESNLYRLIIKSKLPTAEKFEEWVFEKVLPSIRKHGRYEQGINRRETPNFIVRYNENFRKVEKGHFSVISELFVRLYAQLEHVGYQIPNKSVRGIEIRPDVSVGLCFPKWLQDNYPHLVSRFKYYKHRFPAINKEVDARMYENDCLPAFIEYVDTCWIPTKAATYFKDRDLKALDYLPKLLEPIKAA